MPNRFVILHHRHPRGEHWDLMLEQGEGLLTWQLFGEPTGPESLPLRARRIGLHRKAYLTYEGPVSGDRGDVRRVDEGTVEYSARSESALVIELCGRRLSGRFTLSARTDDPEQVWTFETI